MSIKKIIVIVFGAMCMVSCSKFLEEYSPTDLTPKTAGDYGEILFSNGYPAQNSALQPWLPFLSDDVQCYVGPAVQWAMDRVSMTKNIFQWQADFTTGSASSQTSIVLSLNSWKSYYQLILGTNVVIHGIETAIGSQEDKYQFKGEAYVLRAFYHFMLVNMYAKPYNDSTTTPDQSAGIPIRTTPDLSDDYPVRNTVKEVYNQITSDLDSAIFLLEKRKNTSDIFRISYLAAHLLASRVNLYMENWEAAVEHANVVIQKGRGLMDYSDWGGARPTAEKALIGPDNVESLWCYGSYTDAYPTSFGFGNVFEVSHDLINVFEDNDLRKQIGIFVVPSFLKPWIAIEYQQFKVPNDYEGNSRLEMNNSWRVSEAYLNRAEALIQLHCKSGDVSAATEALKSLNDLRQRRMEESGFQPWTIQPGDILLDMCRTERRRELYFEEAHRWFDLRRYGMPELIHTYYPDILTAQRFTLGKRDPQYVCPIPEEVHARNPLLTRNPIFNGIRMPE